eukprot:scaffold133_cov257-Pinguiococcus_pyrenoidosus.AAC.11
MSSSYHASPRCHQIWRAPEKLVPSPKQLNAVPSMSTKMLSSAFGVGLSPSMSNASNTLATGSEAFTVSVKLAFPSMRLTFVNRKPSVYTTATLATPLKACGGSAPGRPRISARHKAVATMDWLKDSKRGASVAERHFLDVTTAKAAALYHRMMRGTGRLEGTGGSQSACCASGSFKGEGPPRGEERGCAIARRIGRIPAELATKRKRGRMRTETKR